jgi:hypothetical protein
METLNPDHVAWSRDQYDIIRVGGVWGVPRSGLMFTKRDGWLELTARMPYSPLMPLTAEQLREQQQNDFDIIQRYFAAAGIPVIDKT